MSNARTVAAGIAAALVPAAKVDVWLPARYKPPLGSLDTVLDQLPVPIELASAK
jgi:hypothetical protein